MENLMIIVALKEFLRIQMTLPRQSQKNFYLKLQTKHRVIHLGNKKFGCHIVMNLVHLLAMLTQKQ